MKLLNLFKKKEETVSESSQQGKVLKMLRRAGSKGVANYEFPQNRVLKYNARISELRQDGYNIYAERVILPNGRFSGVWRYYLNEKEN